MLREGIDFSEIKLDANVFAYERKDCKFLVCLRNAT